MASKLVIKTAKEMCGAFYDNQDVFKVNTASRSERFRQEAGPQDEFIQMNWPHFVAPARAVLAQMLTEPGRRQNEKDAIFDALLQDRGFLTDEQLAAPSLSLPAN